MFVSLWSRSNVSYGEPVLELLPLATGGSDVYSNVTHAYTPYRTLPFSRQHRNLTKLAPFAAVPATVETHYVTNCEPSNTGALAALVAGIPSISLSQAIAGSDQNYLGFAGYSLNGAFSDYRGGGLFFMADRANDRFHPGPQCTLWQEPLVWVGTDDHWVAFTGYNFVPGFNDSATVRAVIDGVQLPAANVRVRDMELVEVLLPAYIGRRRLQIDVNGVRSNGVVLVNAKPVVHGFMEWRLGVEDIRGRSSRAEDSWNANPDVADPGWGGFGAWVTVDKCMMIELIGFHFGSDSDFQLGKMLVTVNERPCEFQQDNRFTRLTCCCRFPTATVIVRAGGQISEPAYFQPSILVRKPIITVRPDLVANLRHRLFRSVYRLCLCVLSVECRPLTHPHCSLMPSRTSPSLAITS